MLLVLAGTLSSRRRLNACAPPPADLQFGALGRRPRKPILRLALAPAGALLCSLAATPALASAGGGVVTHTVGQDPAEVLDYWTPERMRDAVPLDSPQPAAARAGQGGARAAAAPTDFETSPAADTLYPQRVHGRLFYTIESVNSYCSATVVTAPSGNVVLTAGHCLVQAGTPATNVAFVPGYRNGAAPLGVFPAVAIHTPLGLGSYDIAAVNLAGRIQDLLGSRGVTFNRQLRNYEGKSFQIFGYPGYPDQFYDGERLILCVSPFIGFVEVFDELGRLGGAGLGAAPCNQQFGASGGGWVDDRGVVNSVTSRFGCTPAGPDCTLLVGPVFGPLVLDLWARAAGGVPKKRIRRIKRCRRKIRKRAKRQRCINRALTFQPVVR